MKTFEQILEDNFSPDWEHLDKKRELPYILMAMKEVHDQAVELCAERAELKHEPPHFFQYCDCWNTSIDRDSILNVKKLLK